jgi:hypothetical protein
MNKILVLIILLVSSTVSLASDRYTLTTSGKGVIAWILDQKTGVVYSCHFNKNCKALANLKK